MFPNFVFLSKHISEKVKVYLVFKCTYDFNRRHILLIFPIIKLVLNFVQGMLLRKNIILPFHVLDFLNLTDFQGVKLMWELLVAHLEDLGEITVAQFLDGVELFIS